MSSMRNAVPRRPHRERAQPHGRERHGLLEKHKDYSLRSRDFNLKKQRLKALRQKAVDRNPDEFHFGMMSSRTKDGVKVADRGNVAMNVDLAKLLKTQDIGYLRTMIGKMRKEKERLMQELQLVRSRRGAEEARTLRQQDAEEGEGEDGDESQSVRHTVFVDEDERDTFDAAEWFDTDEAGLNKGYNRPRRKSVPQNDEDGLEEVANDGIRRDRAQVSKEAEKLELKAKQAAHKKRKALQERRRQYLKEVEKKESELQKATETLEHQRAQMSNSVGGVNKHGVKFKIRGRKK